MLFRKFFCGTISLYTLIGRGVTRRDSAHAIPKVKLCMQTICHSKGLSGQSTIFVLFGPDIRTEMGVIIYMHLKHFPDYINSKYMYMYIYIYIYIYIYTYIYMGSWFNSLGSSVFAEIPFLAVLALHSERKSCSLVGPSPC